MFEKTPDADKTVEELPELSKADAAKAVKRTVPDLDEDGKQKINKDKSLKFKDVAIKENEIMACKDYGTHIVVVTTDGQKFDNK